MNYFVVVVVLWRCDGSCIYFVSYIVLVVHNHTTQPVLTEPCVKLKTLV